MQPASGKDSGEGMANLTFTGSSELNDAFTRISEIPWPVTEQALDGMAKVAAAASIWVSGMRTAMSTSWTTL